MQNKRTFLFLVEIFIIVTVLGLLAAIAIPRLGSMMEKSKSAPQGTEFHHVQTASTGIAAGYESAEYL